MSRCITILLTMLLIVNSLSLKSGYSVDVVKNLTQLLFKTNAYDNTLRPSMEFSSATQLSVVFNLMSINKLDELEKKLVTTAYLALLWRDEFLTWNMSEYPAHLLSLPQNMIWKPDLVLKNGFTEFKELGGSFYYISVSSDGTVKWKPYQVFESQCSIDVTYFPYDTQTCDIVFTLWSHSKFEVNVEASEIEMDRTEYQSNSIWEILSTSQNIDNTGRNTVLTYSLHLKRKPLYFVQNIILPILFLGILNILVFVIPADAGEKMSYSITVALGFMVFLTIINSELPANSDNTPHLSSYLQTQIVMGGVALVVSSLQLRLRHRNESQKVNRFFKVIVKVSLCNIPKRKNAVATSNVPVDEMKEQDVSLDEEEGDVSWNDVSSAIDSLMFVIYFLVYVISTVCVMAILEGGL